MDDYVSAEERCEAVEGAVELHDALIALETI